MSLVLRHLLRTYWKVYAWFLGIMLIVVGGMSAGWAIWGPWTDADGRKEGIWETVSAQAPKWFLFSMAIMCVTVSMPMLIANGITRRSVYKGGMAYSTVMSVAFGLLTTAGYMIETGNASNFTFLALSIRDGLTFSFAGWLIALLYMRFRPWFAVILTPFAGASLALATVPFKWSLMVLVAQAVVAYGVWLSMATIALRPKKA